jgi:hypothetical protein
MSSPPLPRIIFDTPPPSPGPSHITLTSVGPDHSYAQIISPVKQSRTVRTKVTRAVPATTRKRLRVTEDRTAATEFTVPVPQLYPHTDNDYGHDESQWSGNLDVEMPDLQDAPDASSKGDTREGYADYVTAVLEDSTAFFQISNNMFVVHGWDIKTRRSKVFIFIQE